MPTNYMLLKKTEGSEFFNDTQAAQNGGLPIFHLSTSKDFFFFLKDATADKTQTKKHSTLWFPICTY